MGAAYGAPMERFGEDLTADECWELLALSSIGRLALSVRALPTILPVRYVVDDDETVAIDLGRSGMPAAHVHDSVVAFAVDRIDASDTTGWIVHLQGLARSTGPMVFGAGTVDTDQVVRLVPGIVTGHRFVLRPFTPGP